MSLDYSELLLAVVKQKASDLHITAGSPPMLRVRGSLIPIEGVPSLTPTDTREFIYAILNNSQRQRLETDDHAAGSKADRALRIRHGSHAGIEPEWRWHRRQVPRHIVLGLTIEDCVEVGGVNV